MFDITKEKKREIRNRRLFVLRKYTRCKKKEKEKENRLYRYGFVKQ
jgi:hypothetical protein